MVYTQHSRSSKDYKPNDVMMTPPEIFDALQLEFDLDPAHPPFSTNVPCKRYFTEADDGLAQPWEGLVWVNPPYSQATPWIDKFLQHGNGIMLVHISKSNAFIRLWEHPEVSMLVQTGKHITFITAEGKRKPVFMPVAFFAMGETATTALRNSGLGRIR